MNVMGYFDRWGVSAGEALELKVSTTAPEFEVAIIRFDHYFRDPDPTRDWVLEPGDMLYLPPGVPHHGVAEDACLTFSIGMRAPAAAELLGDFVDTLAGEADDSLRFADPDLQPAKDAHEIDAAAIRPLVTWGTSPEMVTTVDGRVPRLEEFTDPVKRRGAERALEYMGLTPGTPIRDIRLDKIFIGSCTNSRIEDLRAAAAVVRGRHLARNIKLAMVVPGSGLVKRQAEAEGLDKIFTAAGFEWREPGCSMCLAMNPDRLAPGERCASTSNRNFEGRQGFKGRTHLVSPAMAAAAAVTGHFVDVRDWH